MRRRLRHGRQKALFGAAEASAILGAAAITSAATLAGAKMSRDATIQGAKDQAREIKENAAKQAEALAKQDENNKKLNENIINTNKEIAEQQKQYQQDIQMNMALMAGKENMDNRLEMSKMFAKRGGRLGEYMNNKQSLLRGGNNIRFKLPRRGNVELVGVTPEGYNLYSIYGPSHKSGGVDIDFENGGKIEAEGDAAKTGRNKKGFRLGGEYMLTTPNDAFFISQHDINGFNPAEAVDNGMHPLKAFNIQEYNKELIGANDDGTRRAMNGTQLINAGLNSIGNPNFLNADDGAVIISAMNKRQLRNGGRVKAAAGNYMNGYNVPWYNYKTNSTPKNRTYENMYGVPWNQYISTPSISTRDIQQITPSTPNSLANAGITGTVDLSGLDLSVKPNTTGTNTRSGGNFSTYSGLIGAGISSAANIGAALIGQSAANRAANIIADARRDAYGRIVDAANNFKGIDDDFINNSKVDAAIYIPVLRRVAYNINPQLADVERDEKAYQTSLARNSLSAAAMNKRIAKSYREANDRRMHLYAEKANRENDIRNKNIDSINEAARFNAESKNQANRLNASNSLFAAKYNADVNNRKWEIIGNAGSDMASTIGDTYGNVAINNANLIGNAITSSGIGFSSALNNMAKRKSDIEQVMLGADPDNVNAYYAYSSNVSNKQAAARLESLRNEYNSIKDSNPERAGILLRRIREIENARGF